MNLLVVGSAILDLIARPISLVVGDTSNDATITWSAGGAGRNVAENLARLGASVTFVTDVADDAPGRFLTASLQRELPDGRNVFRKPIDVRVCRRERTGIYLAILGDHGRLDRGYCQTGTENISIADLEAVLPGVASFDGAVIDANLNPQTIEALADRCRRAGVPYALETVARERALRVARAIPGCALIKPDRLEAEALTGLPCRTPREAVDCANALVARGAANVIISLGAEGMVFADAERHLTRATLASGVVDVTGAGDAMFSAAFLGLVRGLPPEHFVVAGLRAAALACGWRGAVTPELTDAVFEDMKEPSRDSM